MNSLIEAHLHTGLALLIGIGAPVLAFGQTPASKPGLSCPEKAQFHDEASAKLMQPRLLLGAPQEFREAVRTCPPNAAAHHELG